MTENHDPQPAEPDVPEGFAQRALGPGFSAAFGPVYRHRSEPRMGFRVGPQHLNPVGVCHGGALATFADMLIATVHGGAGSSAGHAPTITLSIDFLAPAPPGSWVEGEALLVKATGNMLFVQALIRVEGEIVARTNAIYRRYAPRPEG